VILQTNYDVLKLQECQLLCHQITSLKIGLRHQNDITNFSIFKPF